MAISRTEMAVKGLYLHAEHINIYEFLVGKIVGMWAKLWALLSNQFIQESVTDYYKSDSLKYGNIQKESSKLWSCLRLEALCAEV